MGVLGCECARGVSAHFHAVGGGEALMPCSMLSEINGGPVLAQLRLLAAHPS